VLALPFYARLSRRLSKHRSWSLILLVASTAFLFFPFVGPDQIWLFGLLAAVIGASMGADLALPPAMQADVLDIDRLHTHEERAGLFFAFWGMATKLALALAVGFAFPLLEIAGFVVDFENSVPAKMMLLALFVGAPVLLKLMSLGLMWHYPLSRNRQEALRRRLSRRPAARKKAVPA
jgi:GPH family glycoside/pentoside/hexuronide:cation symporter